MSNPPIYQRRENRKTRYAELADSLFVCSACKKHKPGSDFAFDSWRSNGINKKCRDCTRSLRLKNRYERRDIARAARNVLYADGCIVCGEAESCCLHLHHLDPSIKESKFSQLYSNGNLQRIESELAKGAVVLCANCHAKVHAGIIALPHSPEGVHPPG